MDMTKPNRRHLAVLAAGAAAAGVVGAATEAAAYQGNMERALGALGEAMVALRESTPNKGGHRERAMGLVQQAIDETQAGIVYANEHGGG
ncbi:hypothetical protein [Xanthobacter sediminis]